MLYLNNVLLSFKRGILVVVESLSINLCDLSLYYKKKDTTLICIDEERIKLERCLLRFALSLWRERDT